MAAFVCRTFKPKYFPKTFQLPKFSTHRCCSTHAKLKTVKNLRDTKPINEKVKVQGWIKGIRKLGGVLFVDINDGSGSGKEILQVIADPILKNKLTFGSAVDVEGEITASSHPMQAIELKAESIKILGPCDPSKFPFRNKTKYTFDQMRQYLHLRPRMKSFQSVLKIRNEATMALHHYFQENGYCLIHTPIITTNDCEGGGETFEVHPGNKIKTILTSETDSETETPKSDSFFGNKVFLTVSGQLQLETVACGGFPKVYTLNPAFRAENCGTKRHLNEFYMLEAEVAFVDTLDEIMEIIEDLVVKTSEKILSKCEMEMKDLEKSQGIPGNLDQIKSLLDSPFEKCTYTEAMLELKRNSKEFKVNPEWGMSFHREHEKFLVTHFGNKPLFVTNFPALNAPFYMKANPEEEKTVAAVDLLVPRVGELCGGSLREDDLHTLQNKLNEFQGAKNLEWYLDLRRFGSTPHGGFGLGFDRYIQFLCGINNIKDSIPFPRWSHHCSL